MSSEQRTESPVADDLHELQEALLHDLASGDAVRALVRKLRVLRKVAAKAHLYMQSEAPRDHDELADALLELNALDTSEGAPTPVAAAANGSTLSLADRGSAESAPFGDRRERAVNDEPALG